MAAQDRSGRQGESRKQSFVEAYEFSTGHKDSNSTPAALKRTETTRKG